MEGGGYISVHLHFLSFLSSTWRRETRDRMLKQYPDAYTWEAAPWSTFNRRWVLDCTEYHHHEGERDQTPESSVPSSPSSLSASTMSRAPSPVPPSPAPPNSNGHARRSSPKLSKDELQHLASFKPGPGPLSPQRMNQQFARVLGPQAVAPSIAQAPAGAPSITIDEAARRPASSQRALPPTITRVPHPHTPRADRKKSKGRSEEVSTDDGAVMYAVTGRNRVFQDR